MPDEIDTNQIGNAKGIEGAVKHCMSCGVEFETPLRSADKIKCSACDTVFSVRVYPNE